MREEGELNKAEGDKESGYDVGRGFEKGDGFRH